jgi:DNA-binding PadR family transcriptional regulator
MDHAIDVLRAEYEAEAARVKAAKARMHAIESAIAVLEYQHQVDGSPASDSVVVNMPRTKRGEVSRMILDVLRTAERPCTIQQVRKACKGRGLHLSGSSVSNAISRLQAKGIVRGGEDGWVLLSSEQQRLLASLRESVAQVENNPRTLGLPHNAEGPEAEAAGPYLNGAASPSA